jgi:hypothetical protein
VEEEALVSRREVAAMPLRWPISTSTSTESSTSSKESGIAKKDYRKRTPEEKARQRENQRRLEELIELRLKKDGTTREEIRRQLGLPE